MPDLLELAVAVGAGNAFAGTVTAVHDGDTVHVTVLDPLLSVPVVLAVRILGINAAELNQPGGPEGRAALEQLLPPGAVVTLRQVRPDKYAGRTGAQVTTAAGVDVATWMVELGLAVPWGGVGPKPAVPWPPTTDATTR